MNILQAILLGIIQGLTEFLPVSSSAHLVIVPYLLGWRLEDAVIFPFDVLVQLGTLLAVILFFRRDLRDILVAVWKGIISGKPFGTQNARLGWLLVLATIPAGIAGLLIKDQVEAAFKDVRMTALFLLVTALILLAAERVGKRSRNLESVNWKDALWIGIAQILSLFPGVSRSGSTIGGGMARNFDRPAAARFSFLMSIPVMLAAGGLSFLDLLKVPDLSSFLPSMAAGFIMAAVVGYLAIRWLLGFLGRRSLYVFAVYCTALSVIVLLVSYA
jgi:undecaprenyl-diphosphatase